MTIRSLILGVVVGATIAMTATWLLHSYFTSNAMGSGISVIYNFDPIVILLSSVACVSLLFFSLLPFLHEHFKLRSIVMYTISVLLLVASLQLAWSLLCPGFLALATLAVAGYIPTAICGILLLNLIMWHVTGITNTALARGIVATYYSFIAVVESAILILNRGFFMSLVGPPVSEVSLLNIFMIRLIVEILFGIIVPVAIYRILGKYLSNSVK